MPINDSIIKDATTYNTKKLNHFGPTFLGVDWNSKESQELRFDQLLKVIDKSDDNFSIIDYGCGYVVDTIASFNALTVRGFTFNMLIMYSDKNLMKDNLFYANPLFLFDYCKLHFSKNVVLLHDYSLYEFTRLL